MRCESVARKVVCLRKRIFGGGWKIWGRLSHLRLIFGLTRVQVLQRPNHCNEGTGSTQESGKYIKNGFEILPNPQRLFDKIKPVNIYFEIYNLPVSGNAQTAFEIEYKIKLLKKDNQSFFDRIKGIFARSSGEISNKVERFATEEKSIEYLALDLSKQDTGQYELEINVTSPLNNETTNNKIKFNLK